MGVPGQDQVRAMCEVVPRVRTALGRVRFILVPPIGRVVDEADRRFPGGGLESSFGLYYPDERQPEPEFPFVVLVLAEPGRVARHEPYAVQNGRAEEGRRLPLKIVRCDANLLAEVGEGGKSAQVVGSDRRYEDVVGFF